MIAEFSKRWLPHVGRAGESTCFYRCERMKSRRRRPMSLLKQSQSSGEMASIKGQDRQKLERKLKLMLFVVSCLASRGMNLAFRVSWSVSRNRARLEDGKTLAPRAIS